MPSLPLEEMLPNHRRGTSDKDRKVPAVMPQALHLSLRCGQVHFANGMYSLLGISKPTWSHNQRPTDSASHDTVAPQKPVAPKVPFFTASL